MRPNARTIVVLNGVASGGLVSAAFAKSIPLGAIPRALATGDFNQDSFKDFAVLSSDQQTVAIFIGDGHGNFTERFSTIAGRRLAVGPGTVSLTVQDVTGPLGTPDGIPDLLVANEFGDVLMLAGNGNGTFKPLSRAVRDVPLVVADLDGDGRDDVILANRSLDQVSLVTGVQLTDAGSDGTFLATGSTDSKTRGVLGPGAVQLVNLNDDSGDGVIDPKDFADLVVANSGGNTVLIYQGLGHGVFGDAVTYFAGGSPAGVTIADINFDGRPDLVIANQGSNDVSILLNQAATVAGGAATFTPGPRLNTGAGSGPVSTAVMDLTGDGILDLVVTNAQSGTATLLPGVGGGFFNDVDPALLAIGNTGLQGAS